MDVLGVGEVGGPLSWEEELLWAIGEYAVSGLLLLLLLLLLLVMVEVMRPALLLLVELTVLERPSELDDISAELAGKSDCCCSAVACSAIVGGTSGSSDVASDLVTRCNRDLPLLAIAPDFDRLCEAPLYRGFTSQQALTLEADNYMSTRINMIAR